MKQHIRIRRTSFLLGLTLLFSLGMFSVAQTAAAQETENEQRQLILTEIHDLLIEILKLQQLLIDQQATESDSAKVNQEVEPITVEVIEDDIEIVLIDTPYGKEQQGRFTLTFDVTAGDKDIYITSNAYRIKDEKIGASSGTLYGIQSAAEYVYSGKIEQATVVSPLTEKEYYQDIEYNIVRAGETERFSLEVSYTPEESKYYNTRIHSISYKYAIKDRQHKEVVFDNFANNGYRFIEASE